VLDASVLARVMYEATRARNRLEYLVGKLRERDELLFERYLQAQIERDPARAGRYAAEVAELRRTMKPLLAYKYVLDKLVVMIEGKLWRLRGASDEERKAVELALEAYLAAMHSTALMITALAPEIGAPLLEALDKAGASDEEPPRSLLLQLLEEADAKAGEEMRRTLPELPSTMPIPAAEAEG
jgi:division protein CdvB (Snf7/Vps24/ESCRT-III family)